MKYAIVDLGSNTIRLSVYQTQEDGRFRLLFSEKETAGLANYISGGRMRPRGIVRAGEVLMDFKRLLMQFAMEELHVFATASLRNIRNTEEAVQTIHEQTGLYVDVISGAEEAELSYYGAANAANLSDGVLFDIGGGSTELVNFSGGIIQESHSLEIGCLNLFRKNVEKLWPQKAEMRKIVHQVHRALSSAQMPSQTHCVCGVGGTARALLNMANSRLGSEGRVLTADQLKAMTELLQRRSREARDLILAVCPDRVHTIIPGAILMMTLVERLGCQKIWISPYGVREGYLCRKLQRNMI